jgi:hypothetical protein
MKKVSSRAPQIAMGQETWGREWGCHNATRTCVILGPVYYLVIDGFPRFPLKKGDFPVRKLVN